MTCNAASNGVLQTVAFLFLTTYFTPNQAQCTIIYGTPNDGLIPYALDRHTHDKSPTAIGTNDDPGGSNVGLTRVRVGPWGIPRDSLRFPPCSPSRITGMITPVRTFHEPKKESRSAAKTIHESHDPRFSGGRPPDPRERRRADNGVCVSHVVKGAKHSKNPSREFSPGAKRLETSAIIHVPSYNQNDHLLISKY